VLFDKTGKTLEIYPNGKSNNYTIPDDVTSIGDFAFISCVDLASITIPNSVTSIGSHTFTLCGNLKSIVFPDSMSTIGGIAFSGTQIQTITLPPSIQEFGIALSFSGSGIGGPFADMPDLENIVFEPGTKAIAANAFSGITAPVNVYMPKSVESISPDSGLSSNTIVYAFADSFAEGYVRDNGIPYETIPIVIAEDLPKGYQYLPYSLSFASSPGSWLEVVERKLPDGLIISETLGGNRTQGEIWGVPTEHGTFPVTLRATNGTPYLLTDEVPFEINIEEYELLTWPGWEDQHNSKRIEIHLGTYDPVEGIHIVKLFDTEPEDVKMRIGCSYGDFIGLWIDGELLERSTIGTRDGDYHAREGSTVVTIYGRTLERINNNRKKNMHLGEDHIIAAEFKVGREPDGEQYKVAQNFRIRVVPNPNLKKDDNSNNANNAAGGTIRNTSINNRGNITGVSTETNTRDIAQPIPTPMERSSRTTIIIHADVSLDDTGTVAYATVLDDEVLDAAEEVAFAADQLGVQSAIQIQIDAPRSAIEFNLELTDVSMTALSESGVDTLIIACPRLGAMTVGKSTIAAIKNMQGGQKAEISIRHLSDASRVLSERQRLALNGDNAVMITIKSEGSYLSNLGGTMNVDLPYTLKPGQRAGGIYVYHLAGDGKATTMPSAYIESDSAVAFDTTHLSVYAIGYSAAAANATMPGTRTADRTYVMLSLLCAFLLLTWLIIKRLITMKGDIDA